MPHKIATKAWEYRTWSAKNMPVEHENKSWVMANNAFYDATGLPLPKLVGGGNRMPTATEAGERVSHPTRENHYPLLVESLFHKYFFRFIASEVQEYHSADIEKGDLVLLYDNEEFAKTIVGIATKHLDNNNLKMSKLGEEEAKNLFVFGNWCIYSYGSMGTDAMKSSIIEVYRCKDKAMSKRDFYWEIEDLLYETRT